MNYKDNQKINSSESLNNIYSRIVSTFVEKKYLQVLAAFLLISIALDFIYHGIIIPYERINMDFRVYYEWARLYKVDGWYVRKINTEEPHFYYPPFWGMVLHPLTFLPFRIAKLIWLVFNVLLVCLFIWLGSYWIKKNVPEYQFKLKVWMYFFLLIIILAYKPVSDTLRGGQVNLLLLILFALSLYSYEKNKKIITGVLLGLASLTKLVPILLMGYWFLKREYKIVLSTILTVVFATVITVLLYGPATHIAYLHNCIIYSRYTYENWTYQANVSFYSLIRELQSFGLLPQYIPAIIIHCFFALTSLTLFLLLTFSRSYKKLNSLQLKFEYVACIALIPLILAYTEPHHFTWLLTGYVVAFVYGSEYRSTIAKILLIFSWFLVNIGYAIDDLTALEGRVPGMRHIHFFGMLLLYIGLLLIIYEVRKKYV